jgi:hypothetical protein
MNTDTYMAVIMSLTITGWSLSLIVWAGYTAAAPWYSTSAGRQIWALLGSILAVLSISMLRIAFDDFPFRRELIVFAMSLFDIALLGMGITIYRAQVLRYHKAKYLKTQKDKYH